MFLIVGLGNPGLKYKKTRHNFGFKALDYFRKENNFPRFKFVKKFQAALSENIIENQKVILAKPQTFMNASGQAVKKITTNCQLPTANRIVIHDDLDIPLGEIRISQNKSAGGHKGVQSIIDQLGSQDFIRLRLGVGQTDRTKYDKNFVLSKFTPQEKPLTEKTIKKAGQELNKLLAQQTSPATGGLLN